MKEEKEGMEERKGFDGEYKCEQEAEPTGKEHAVLVQRAKRKMPEESKILQMCAGFKAIGEPSRMKILLALMEGELCVYHIMQAVGGNQSNVSHQLRILKDARIIRARREGKNVVYSIADEHVASILMMSRAHLECAGEV